MSPNKFRLPQRSGKLLDDPRHFSKHQSTNNPTPLFAVPKFYLKAFALAFAIVLIADQFRLYEGSSEVRDLLKLVPQLIIGFLVLFLMFWASRNHVLPGGLLQMMLYVDGVYLLFSALLAVPFSYLDYALLVPAGVPRELVYSDPNLRNALAHNPSPTGLSGATCSSFLYSDKWQPAHWAKWLTNNQNYIVSIPFLFLFAQMARKRYGANFVVVLAAAAIAFVAATEIYRWGIRKSTEAIANNSNCEPTYVKTVLSTYSVERIARQLEFKLSNYLQKAVANPNVVIRLQGNDYVQSLNLRRTPTSDGEQISGPPSTGLSVVIL